MSAKRIAVLVIVPIAVFAVSVGLFLLLAHPGRAGAAEPPSYTLVRIPASWRCSKPAKTPR